MFKLSCKAMGMEGCNFVAEGETVEEAMHNSREHGTKVHRDEMRAMQDTMSEDEIEQKMRTAVVEE